MLYELAKNNGIKLDQLSLGIIGVNFRTSSIEDRELLSDPKVIYKAFEIPEVEHAVISTCNRTEIVYSSPVNLFSEVKSHILGSIRSLLPSFLPENFNHPDFVYDLQNEHATRHFFKLASGLDSMVLGEAEILGQLKKSYKEAVRIGTVKSNLHKLFQSAFKTAKEVRSTTGIGRGRVSVASTALLALKNVFGDLSSRRVLLIGAGETSLLMARHLKSSGVSEFFVANRSLETARNVLSETNGVFLPLDRIPMVLAGVDIVISAINSSANSYILKSQDFVSIKKSEGRKTFCIVDLSVPRVVDPLIGDLSSVYLFNVDGLSTLANQNKAFRQSEADRAIEIIDVQVQEYQRWQENRIQHILIQNLFSYFDVISTQERQRTLKTLSVVKEKDLVTDSLNKSYYSLSRKLFDPLLKGIRNGEISDEEIRVFLKCLGVVK